MGFVSEYMYLMFLESCRLFYISYVTEGVAKEPPFFEMNYIGRCKASEWSSLYLTLQYIYPFSGELKVLCY